MNRYDEGVQGKLNPDYDVVCPKCHSAVGFPCTRKVMDGHQQVMEIHEERRNVLNETRPK